MVAFVPKLEKTIRIHGIGLCGTREGKSAVFPNISAHLWEQLQKKEDVLFPAILSETARPSRHLFHEVRESYEKLSRHFEVLHRLTSGFTVGPTICVAEKALMRSLQEPGTCCLLVIDTGLVFAPITQ